MDLGKSLEGEFFTDEYTRLQYATDASVYREVPLAVSCPASVADLRRLIAFAASENLSLIPRTAGTSLAGQVVGGGIVVDVSRHFGRILEFNIKEKWVRVQPGVVLDELNQHLSPHGLFFAPETSTGNRCMLGGMVGNNSCGAHSLIYGSVRDHTLEVETLLSDGSKATFGPLTSEELEQKLREPSLEGNIYRQIHDTLRQSDIRQQIIRDYPHPGIRRRNTGYAIDLLANCQPFNPEGELLNLSRLICGSEGTLALITAVKLKLIPIPPKHKGLLCVHFHSLDEAFLANLTALEFQPGAIELMDNKVLEQTKNNITQKKNRFFIKGEPEAVMIIEWARETTEEVQQLASETIQALKKQGMGYHFPLVTGEDIPRVWELRKAGLGVLNNIPGDKKPVAVVEDTAVHPKQLPQFMKQFREILKKLDLSCVYYAHIATGELHLRPVLNLKDPKDVERFHQIALETAKLVKKYRGALSGEHGDGRLRGEFLPLVLGESNYQILRKIKYTWDPQNIFNPGKIVDAPSMKNNLRYIPGKPHRAISTIFDFSENQGVLRAAEQCNGSGDCRRSNLAGGAMCPTYKATLNEEMTTRARANILREFLTNSPKINPFHHKEIYNVMDMCLACKACKAECPSNVDITKYKAEFLYQYYKKYPTPLRTNLISNISKLYQLGSVWPALFNFFISNKLISSVVKKVTGFAPKRTVPVLGKYTLRQWIKTNGTSLKTKEKKGEVTLFVDEFSNYNDVEIGIKMVKLLTALGYQVYTLPHKPSGRAWMSKGMLDKAKKLAIANVSMLKDKVNAHRPLIGIEPSAILSFRDEYPDLTGNSLKKQAIELGKNCLMYDEFIANEIDKGNICPEAFTSQKQNVLLHGHCHQKALASTTHSKKMLELPENYSVTEISGGCCGMAGAFGYEKEHYQLSMMVGEMNLFPNVRKAPENTIIAAPGTSCRHQIKDGTGKNAYHPAEVLYEALKK